MKIGGKVNQETMVILMFFAALILFVSSVVIWSVRNDTDHKAAQNLINQVKGDLMSVEKRAAATFQEVDARFTGTQSAIKTQNEQIAQLQMKNMDLETRIKTLEAFQQTHKHEVSLSVSRPPKIPVKTRKRGKNEKRH